MHSGVKNESHDGVATNPIVLNKIVFIGSALISIGLIVLTILFPKISETLLG